MPDCEIFIVPECGHSAYWERPDMFNLPTAFDNDW